jgi:predicted RNase H-like HicB family nuclease
MERIVRVHVEKLPEGVYLATSDEVPGLVAQGRTMIETLEIARDVARKLLKAAAGQKTDLGLSAIGDSLDYPLIVES